MPVTINGRNLGVATNGVFTKANTDPIPGGRLWPEAALTWNAMHAAYVADGGHPGDFAPAGPVSSARPRSAQDHFWTHQPPPAARPYSSNHGWGIAVDVKTRQAVAWLLKNAAKYGWSWDEGQRVGEWWHWRYVGASPALLRKLARDPLAGYTTAEQRWIRELDELMRKPSRSVRDEQRIRALQRVMVTQRKRIWTVANRDGWTTTRKRRYESLRARTT
jgi:hypothetical protein